MFESIYYISSFLLAILAITIYPKSKERINGLICAVISYVSLLCLGAVYAFAMNVLQVPITLITMGTLYICMAAIYFLLTFRKKHIQKLFVKATDIVSILLIFLIIGGIALYIFTPFLHIRYANAVDPSNHYAMAMQVVRTEKLDGLFFTPLYNGMFIRALQWALPLDWTYKAYILADVFHNAMQFVFFFAVATVLLKNTKKKFLPLIVSIVYWCGFPFLSYAIGAYAYWGMATMLIQYVLLLLYFYEANTEQRKALLTYIVMGCFSISICYIQFAPAIFLTVLAALIYWAYKQKKLVITKKLLFVSFMILVFVCICAIIGYHFVFASRGLKIFEVLQLGSMEANALELLLISPVIVCILYNVYKQKESWNIFHISLFVHMLLQAGMTILSALGIISTYYLFKSYIILWFLAFSIVMLGGRCLSQNYKRNLKFYFVGIGCFLIFSFNSTESDSLSLNHSIYVQNLSKFINTDFSTGYMSNNQKLYLFEYAMEELETDSYVPLLVTNERLGAVSWYVGLYAGGTGSIKATWSQEDLQSTLDRYNAEYFIVFFDDLLYREQLGDYLDTFERVYENEDGFIARRK